MSIDLEFAIKQDIRNNPVVREVDLAQKKDFLRVLVWASAVVAMLIIALTPRFNAVFEGYKIEELRAEVEREREINRRLTLELETQSRPDVIEQRARRLGLVDPTEADVVVVERVPPSAVPNRAIVAANR